MNKPGFQLRNCTAYYASDDMLLVSNKNILYEIDEHGNPSEIANVNFEIQNILRDDDGMIVLDGLYHPFCIEENRVIEFPVPDVRIRSWRNDRLIFYRKNPASRGIIMSRKIVFESTKCTGYVASSDDYVFCGLGTEVRAFRLKDTEPLWTADLTGLPSYRHERSVKQDELYQILGATDSDVWITTNGNKVVALELATGKIAKVIDCGDGAGNQSPYANYALLDRLRNTIYIYGFEIAIIDLSNKEIVKRIGLSEFYPELKDYWIMSVSLQQHCIVFTAQRLGVPGLQYVGVIDPHREILTFLGNINKDNGLNIPVSHVPVLTTKNLFVLDNMGTLYVFQV